MGKRRNKYNISVEKYQWNSPGRPIRRWKDGIRMDLKLIGCENMNRIYLVQIGAT
jgi:hypothetical protein